MVVRAGQVNTRASGVVTSAITAFIMTAAVVFIVKSARVPTRTSTMVLPTAFEGSGRTRNWMAAVGLRFFVVMARVRVVTGAPVSLLRLSVI